jgi:BirA family biotin operon repressor/biotin-[acetyl-CoA-carboxylase] ligase
MSTKNEVLGALMDAREAISGERLARRLGITRNTVWKAIEQLRAEGYVVEAVTNRGYRLGERNDMLTEAGIRRELGDKASLFTLEVFDTITSTNTVMKERTDALPG